MLDSNASKPLPGPGFRQAVLPFSMIGLLPRRSEKESEKKSKAPKKLGEKEKLQNSVISWLKGLKGAELKECFAYVDANPPVNLDGADLAFETLRLDALTAVENESTSWKQVIAAADKLIELIDIDDLAKSCGVKPLSIEDNEEANTALAERKSALVKALRHKAEALFKSIETGDMPSDVDSQLDGVITSLRQWSDAGPGDACSAENLFVAVSFQLRRHQPGLALLSLLKHDRVVVADSKLKKLQEHALEELGWVHHLKLQQNRYIASKPKDFALF